MKHFTLCFQNHLKICNKSFGAATFKTALKKEKKYPYQYRVYKCFSPCPDFRGRSWFSQAGLWMPGTGFQMISLPLPRKKLLLLVTWGFTRNSTVARPLLQQDIQTFYRNEMFHHKTFSGHNTPEKSCDSWAGLCCRSVALTDAT